jgi:type II secretory pathway predicted ATPase ExeA
MTGEERLKLALDLHELSCEVARAGIRYQHPEASADEVERLLRERIALAYSL